MKRQGWRMFGLSGCCVCMLSGCMMRELKEDRKRAEGYKLISGKVVTAEDRDYPVVVALWGVDEHAQSSYQLADGNGRFTFFTDAGKYNLMAFEDANMDTHFQPETEWFGKLEKPELLDVNSSDSYEGLALTLYPAGTVKVPDEVLKITAGKRNEKFGKSKSAVGEVTTLANPFFTPDYAHMGLWSPLSFIDEVGMRLYFLEPYSPTKTPVLFVHGANGIPNDFKTIIDSLDTKRYQPWVLFYPSGSDLDELGRMASQMMDEAHLEYQFKELILVAHSMGGLVSRAALINYAQVEKRAAVPLYISFSTPWNGHAAAEAGVKHAPAVVPAWYDMLPGSPFINHIQKDPLPGETIHYLFFSFKGKGGSPFDHKNTDGAVSIESQLIPPIQLKAKRVFGINSTHIGILSDDVSLKEFNRLLTHEKE